MQHSIAQVNLIVNRNSSSQPWLPTGITSGNFVGSRLHSTTNSLTPLWGRVQAPIVYTVSIYIVLTYSQDEALLTYSPLWGAYYFFSAQVLLWEIQGKGRNFMKIHMKNYNGGALWRAIMAIEVTVESSKITILTLQMISFIIRKPQSRYYYCFFKCAKTELHVGCGDL